MKEQIRYYKLRAQEYEAIYHKPERQHDLSQIREYLSQQFTGQDVLEIACGTGYWTQILAKSARTILATDINSEVLDMAKTKSYAPAEVSFQIQDLFSLAHNFFLYQGTNSPYIPVVLFGFGIENAYCRDFPPFHLPSQPTKPSYSIYFLTSKLLTYGNQTARLQFDYSG